MGLEGTAEEDEAAAKMQAVQRGKQARKEVEGMKAEASLGLEGTAEEDEAAAKMQAQPITNYITCRTQPRMASFMALSQGTQPDFKLCDAEGIANVASKTAFEVSKGVPKS